MTHGSLFSGIGGFDLGADRAGLKNLWACEIDEFKQAVLRKHFPDTHIYSDVTTLNPPYVDVISGGFPCQDIAKIIDSVAQYQNNMKKKAELPPDEYFDWWLSKKSLKQYKAEKRQTKIEF